MLVSLLVRSRRYSRFIALHVLIGEGTYARACFLAAHGLHGFGGTAIAAAVPSPEQIKWLRPLSAVPTC